LAGAREPVDEAFDSGRLAALDELQDRFCVCMK
jgi:hypothetical protein